MKNTGYTKPNYTQLPNALLDIHMPHMKEAELRVVLAIARATFGWHKTQDKLSITQLMEKTGLTRQGVVNGIQSGVERGVIKREESGMGFIYSLVVEDELVNEIDYLAPKLVNEIDQSTKQTSQPNRLELVNEIDYLAPKLVNEIDSQKKVFKEKKKSSARRQSSKKTDDNFQDLKTQEEDPTKELVKQILAAYVEVRGKNGINHGKEGAWAKRIAKEHAENTTELVKGCYLWLKKDKYLEFKVISLAKVYESLPEFIRYLEKHGTLKPSGTSESEWVIIDNKFSGRKELKNKRTGETKPYVNA